MSKFNLTSMMDNLDGMKDLLSGYRRKITQSLKETSNDPELENELRVLLKEAEALSMTVSVITEGGNVDETLEEIQDKFIRILEKTSSVLSKIQENGRLKSQGNFSLGYDQ